MRLYERLRFESAPFSPYNLYKVLLYALKQRRGRRSYPRELLAHFRDLTPRWPPLLGPALGPPIRIIGLGDLQWLPSASRDYLGPALRRRLEEADLVLGNLETPIHPSAPPVRQGPLPRFNGSAALLTPLSRLRAPLVLNLANNHALDQGAEGLEATVAVLRDAGIRETGVRAPGADQAVTWLCCGGVRIAVLGYCGFVNRPAALQPGRWQPDVEPELVRGDPPARLQRLLRTLQAVRGAGAELIILSLHWGYEYEFLPDPRQLAIARALADGGADILFGHHPHVVQPVELLVDPGRPDGRSCVAAYSLGNLVARAVERPWSFGMLLEVEAQRFPAGVRVIGWRTQPLFLYREGPRCYVEIPAELDARWRQTDPQRLDQLQRCHAFWQRIQRAEFL